MLTLNQLAAGAGASKANATRFLPFINTALATYRINTPTRIAAFLAQIGHESLGLALTSEIWGPTPAQRGYEGRADLGNTQPGDGSRYRGHGLIQTTGRANHLRVTNRLRVRFGTRVPHFVDNPLALCQPEWAALSAGDYWDDKGLNALADARNIELITRRINGGLTGIADRRERWAAAEMALEDWVL
jgi:putative chitinase